MSVAQVLVDRNVVPGNHAEPQDTWRQEQWGDKFMKEKVLQCTVLNTNWSTSDQKTLHQKHNSQSVPTPSKDCHLRQHSLQINSLTEDAGGLEMQVITVGVYLSWEITHFRPKDQLN